MVDHSQMKLGRRAVKTDSRTLCLADYFTPSLPPPPASIDWTKDVTQFGMMLNDRLGDCTIAGLAHAFQIFSLNAGKERTLPDQYILDGYEKWCGYNPKDPSTDNGGIELDVLTAVKKKGFAGVKLYGFADPNVKNLTEVKQGIALFGGQYIGISLPISAQSQDVWDVVPDDGSGRTEPGSWGGHCVFVPKYDPNGFTCITWGTVKKMTLAFWLKYCDESHTLLVDLWLDSLGKSPSGFDFTQLEADIKAIR